MRNINNNTEERTVSAKLPLRLVLIPMIPLLALTALYVYVPEGSNLLIPAAGLWGILTVVCMTTMVLHPLRKLLTLAGEVNKNNHELLDKSQNQAQTLEEIYAAIEQFNQSIHQTTQNSGMANKLSRSTLDAVLNGEKLGDATLDAMSQIFASSHKIKEISQVVHEIASQTNLLAVNAAVEAARGGENAKGFAIVAAEIKNLAKRSTFSAQEIERLVMDNLSRVEKGDAVVRQSGEVLKRIVSNTEETSHVIAELDATMTEQAAAIQQIESAVNQLNQINQDNVMTINACNSKKEEAVSAKIFQGLVRENTVSRKDSSRTA